MTDFKTGPERKKKISTQYLKKVEFTPKSDKVVIFPISESKRMSVL